MDSFILYNDGDLEEQITQLEDDAPNPKDDKAIVKVRNPMVEENEELPTDFWSMDFDGVVSKEGARVRVWMHNHISKYSKNHSYKLKFQCTNNIAEYEALMLGLKLLKKFGAKMIMVRGDSELIIKQIKGEYETKHPRIRAYGNAFFDALQCFTEVDLQVMPTGQNILADKLATSAATCKIPFSPTHKYTVEVKCKPTVPDNIRYWRVFINDDQIEDFLQCKNDFECTNIDLEQDEEVVNKSIFENGSVNTIDAEEINENDVDSRIL
jgi:ribonuclease HI